MLPLAPVLLSFLAAPALPVLTLDPAPGVSLDLAQARKAQVRDLRMDLSLVLPEDRQAPIQGRVVLAFHWSGGSQPLPIDFAPGRAGAVQALTVEGRPVAWKAAPEHLVLPPGALRPGLNRVEITFTAGDAPLNRQGDFLYSLFVPARMREAIPCFDQPDLKLRLTLALDLPASWEALANGQEVSREVKGERLHLRFRETEPLPTYLVAFTAGRFQVATAQRDGRTLRFLHREKDAQKLARNREEVFDLHARALAWMERYTGIPHPFHKLDFAIIPAFQFGGMEHPGNIYYKEASLLLDEHATASEKQARADLIAHEVAHLWFGDLVTMDWFSDVWMKEVFAGFMSAKVVEPDFPEVDHLLKFMTGNHVPAYRIDRAPGANPIRQKLSNLNLAGSLYGPIIYKKAPVMMRQLEALLGPETLRKGLQAYLQAHAYDNAGWPALIAHLQKLTQVDLRTWSRTWVDEPGRPDVETELRLQKGRIQRLAFTQKDPRGRGLVWSQELRVALVAEDGSHQILKVPFLGARVAVPEAKGLPQPACVLPFGEGLGYGNFRPDGRSLQWLRTKLPMIRHDLTRGAAWVTLMDAEAEGRLGPRDLLDLAATSLATEACEENRDLLLGSLQTLFWRLGPAERREVAPSLEALLQRRMQGEKTGSAKAAWLRATRAVATSPAALVWLEQLWKGAVTVPGLTLTERDRCALAQDLALRAVPGWKQILEAQAQAIQNQDRKQEFLWLLPSLDADPGVRRAFFATLQDRSQRAREMWVGQALRFLNHPLRAAEALPDLRAGLDLLPEIQATGDIFFPQSWVGALLGGHSSPEAEQIVRTFLQQLPRTYPLRLRQHVEVEHHRLQEDVARRKGVRP